MACGLLVPGRKMQSSVDVVSSTQIEQGMVLGGAEALITWMTRWNPVAGLEETRPIK
jgi:hypothetical protein